MGVTGLVTESLMLQRLRYSVAQALSAEQITASVDLDEHMDYMLDSMIYHLTAGILAEEVAVETVEVEMEEDVCFLFPSSWWQHLKWSWANYVKRRNFTYRGRWLERIYQPHLKMTAHWRTARKTQVVRTKQFAAFPAATIQTPEKFRGPLLVRKEQVDVR